MAKILHLITDEKFTDNVIENFENVFNNNVFFVLRDHKERSHCNIRKSNIIFEESDFFSSQNVDQDVTTVVVHGLNYVFARLVLQLKPAIKVAWFAWGFDIYNLPKVTNTLYAPETMSYIKKADPKFTFINAIKKNKLFRNLYYKFIKKTDDFYTVYELTHKRIDFFCTYIKEDYNLFQKFYPNAIKYFEIGYFSINQYLAGQPDLRIGLDACNILVGNSNSLENNHLDVFEVLAKSNLPAKVVVPLSYGNDVKYKSVVLERGKKSLGEQFYPLLDFMDRDKYLNLLSNCSAAVFYHYRQQAMGNILALLYMGIRVYLSRRNPVYHYLKRIGIIIFDFDEDFSVYKNTVLETEKQQINRKNLDKIFKEEVLAQQYADLIKEITHVDR